MNNNNNSSIDAYRTPFNKGYVQIYTGNGKGKTTAAIGLALRAAGAGLKVFIGQFIKSGKYSEIKALERFSGSITCKQFGRGCWIKGQPTEEDARLAQEGLMEVYHVIENSEYDLVVLDEADIAVLFGLFGVEELIDLIDMKPDNVELVFTGRRADPRLIDRADLVTEMREVKHYYRQGVIARKGIES
jgi:cob(I)alamin adenosyltransferase